MIACINCKHFTGTATFPDCICPDAPFTDVVLGKKDPDTINKDGDCQWGTEKDKITKIKPYEMRQKGVLLTDRIITTPLIRGCVLEIQVAEDGRVWININGQSYLRFRSAPRIENDNDKG